MTKILTFPFAMAAIMLAYAGMAHAQAPTGAPATGICPPPAPTAPPGMREALLKPGAKAPFMANPEKNDPMFQAYQKKLVEDRARDYPDLCHYKPDNARLLSDPALAPRVVFMGDSITEGWAFGDPSLFAADVADRGISGQSSPQMVLRFYQDVVNLHPRVVHIMAGTNDVAGNAGPFDPENYKNHIRAMVDLAQTNHIQVVLASILPTAGFTWRPDLKPAEEIRSLNSWLKQYAAEKGLVYADYYTSLATPDGAFRPELSNDGIHPNTDGYALMRPVTETALGAASK